MGEGCGWGSLLELDVGLSEGVETREETIVVAWRVWHLVFTRMTWDQRGELVYPGVEMGILAVARSA